jgi:prepilin-type N-terminal cleavage/methylation domain-containing protein
MKTTQYKNGFTLIELLLALVITGIVASAVATLAYAMNSAGVATDDMSRKQAQVRFATLRISDLIRQCKLVCYASKEELAVWAEDKDNNNIINLDEVTYIEAGTAYDHLQLYTFTGSTPINLGVIKALSTNWWSAYGTKNSPATALIPLPTPPKPAQCSNVTFYRDATDLPPPNSKIVSITFNLIENRVSTKYQINAALHARAANLYDAATNSIVTDDD